MQNCFYTVNNQCVTGIVATLKTDDGVRVTAQEIDDFTLTLVSPLGAQNDDAVIHLFFLISVKELQQKSTTEHAHDATDADEFRIRL